MELLEIARRPPLGDTDARGDQPLAHRLAMIARRDPAADAFGEAAEDDALHPDRQQAELFAAQPRDGPHRAFPPLAPAADPAPPRLARLLPLAIVDQLEPVDEHGIPSVRDKDCTYME